MIPSFEGEFRFLSNFWLVQIEFEGMVFPSVENAYQSAKTSDIELRKQFQGIASGKAKRLGKTLVMRADWDEVKVGIMKELIEKKFRNAELRELLLATGEQEIVEGNTWGDVFWGVCRGQGQNILGKIIMETRTKIKESLTWKC